MGLHYNGGAAQTFRNPSTLTAQNKTKELNSI